MSDPRDAQSDGPDEARRSVSQLVDEFMYHVRADKAPKTAYEYERLLRREFLPKFKHRWADEISDYEMARFIDGIKRHSKITGKRKTIAGHTLATVKSMYSWAVDCRLVQHNPCPKIKDKSNIRDRVLNEDEIRTLWHGLSRLETRKDKPLATWIHLSLKFQLVTGQRIEETVNSRWAEIDTENRIWTIPGGRTKNKVKQIVPLTDLAFEILDHAATIREGEYIFPGRNQGSPGVASSVPQAVRRILGKGERKIDMDHFVPHDLRRTANRALRDCFGVHIELIREILNHKNMGNEDRSYLGNKRPVDAMRAALEKWEAGLRRVMAGGELVPNTAHDLEKLRQQHEASPGDNGPGLEAIKLALSSGTTPPAWAISALG